ncbi:MAG: hypothetical protein ACKOAY_05580 [Haliscomenobacter sp.]
MRIAFWGWLGMVLWGLPLNLVFAQDSWKKTMHQTFEVPDSVCLVEIEIPWGYVVERWPTNAMMVEETVELRKIPDSVAGALVKQGRFGLKLACKFGLCVLSPVQTSFPVIRTTMGELEEQIQVRIFLPDDFEKAGDHLWTRMWRP